MRTKGVTRAAAELVIGRQSLNDMREIDKTVASAFYFGFARATAHVLPRRFPPPKNNTNRIDNDDCLGVTPCSCTNECRFNDCVISQKDGCNSVNYDCKDCSLWREIAGCRLRTVPLFCNDIYFYAPEDPKVKNWLIQPTAPNYIGLEDLPSFTSNPALDTLWQQAWGDATTGVDKRAVIKPADLALVINSVAAREKHSLHIHVGMATSILKTCVGALPKATVDNTWKGPVVCKGLSGVSATEPTNVYYTLVTAANRGRVHAYLLDGLEFSKLFVEKDVNVGFALVGTPAAIAKPDDSYLMIYDGKGVSDQKNLIVQ